MGIELLKGINRYLPAFIDNKVNFLRGGGDLFNLSVKYFQNSKDPHLKFQSPKEVAQSYIDYLKNQTNGQEKNSFLIKKDYFPKKI